MAIKNKKPSIDLGKVASSLASQFLTEENIVRMLPVALNYFAASSPLAAQMGITPQMVQAMAASATPALLSAASQSGPQIPDDGAWEMLRSWHKVDRNQLFRAVRRIMDDDKNFAEVRNTVLNSIWFAMGLNAIIDEENKTVEQNGQG